MVECMLHMHVSDVIVRRGECKTREISISVKRAKS